MSIEATTRIMNGYFEALLGGGDFSQYFTDDVSWTTMETGDQVSGRESVRNLIVTLHTETFDATRNSSDPLLPTDTRLWKPTSSALILGNSLTSLRPERRFECPTALPMT